MAQAFVVDYLRSPFALAGKCALTGVRPDDLAAGVVAAIVERSGVDPELVEDVILGFAFPEGEQGFNIARCVVLLAGLSQTVGGSTVNRGCGSSMQAVQAAAGAIALGAGEAFIAGGKLGEGDDGPGLRHPVAGKHVDATLQRRLAQGRRQHRTADDHLPAGETLAGARWRLQQHLQHGRHAVGEGDSFLALQLEQ